MIARPFMTTIVVILLTSITVPTVAEEHYLFSYFKGNGEDGLHLAHSTDGIHWKALHRGQSFLKPAVGKDRLMRDPSIVQGPDGVFHMVWTTGWHDQGIGVAHSEDLIEWSPQTRIGVMDHKPGCRNCWAPEIFYDDATAQYFIFWASTIEDRFPETANSCDNGLNHRMYYVTTKDFQNYSKTRLFFDPGFAVIDSFLVRDGKRYILVTKDETKNPEPEKNLFVADADSASGPFEQIAEPFSPDWVEGPAVLRVGDRWLVYFDEYTRGHYRAMQTRDFESWKPLETPMTHPEGMRHGTAFAVDAEIAQRLLRLTSRKNLDDGTMQTESSNTGG